MRNYSENLVLDFAFGVAKPNQLDNHELRWKAKCLAQLFRTRANETTFPNNSLNSEGVVVVRRGGGRIVGRDDED